MGSPRSLGVDTLRVLPTEPSSCPGRCCSLAATARSPRAQRGRDNPGCEGFTALADAGDRQWLGREFQQCSERPSPASDQTPRRSPEPKAEPQPRPAAPEGLQEAGPSSPLPSPGARGPGLGFSLDAGKGGKQRCAQALPGEQPRAGGIVWLSSLSWGQHNRGNPHQSRQELSQEGPDPKRCLQGAALPCPKAQLSHTER